MSRAFSLRTSRRSNMCHLNEPPKRVLSAQEKAEQAEDERLEAELAKRNDPEILDPVERRLMRLNLGAFSTPWERAARLKQAESSANRIALYDHCQLAPRDGLLAADAARPPLRSGPPFGRPTSPAAKLSNSACCMSGVRTNTPIGSFRSVVPKPLKLAPRERFELPTNGLTVRRSTTELPGNI